MTAWTSLYRYIPPAWREALDRVPPSVRQQAQELRVRSGAPLMLTTAHGNTALDVFASEAQLRDCFWRLCDQAVHTHETELSQGFVTTADGLRVGVAGTAVLKGGVVTTYRDLTSLCIRLPRVVHGCAAPLLPYLDDEGGVRGLLLCGPPASGKTTVLRDMAATLSQKRHIAVVDERAELSLGGLPQCDVLKNCPKTVGILQAVRTLSPDAVVADELGDAAEWEAVAQSCFCGVAVIASVHLRSREELLAREPLRRLLAQNGFDFVAMLPPRCDPNGETWLWKARDLVENGGGLVDRLRLRGHGDRGIDHAS